MFASKNAGTHPKQATSTIGIVEGDIAMPSRISYRIEEAKLVAEDSQTGKGLWKKGFEAPVQFLLESPTGEGCIVLLDYAAAGMPPTFENLIMISADGAVLWKAELPDSHDAYVSVARKDDRIEGNSWSGYVCEIDAQSGRCKNRRFTK